MKLKQPIIIDFLKFFKKGEFDVIKLQKTKSWILNNFPDPDGFDQGPKGFLRPSFNIWRYGNIEFHFDRDNKLWMIFSDYLHDLKGGKFLKLDQWILDDPRKTNLIQVIEALNKENINFTKAHDKVLENLIKIYINSSQVELIFVSEDNETVDPNHYNLHAFSFK